MRKIRRSYLGVLGSADGNIHYIGAAVIGTIFLIVLICGYREQQKCDVNVMAKLYDTYAYVHTNTDQDGNTHTETVYGGKYEFEALGQVYRLSHDSGNHSRRSVPKELKVAYYSDDPSINVVYTPPIFYSIGGVIMVVIICYGLGGLIFKW